MFFIVSPAKTMQTNTDGFAWQTHPHFLSEAQTLTHTLQSKTYAELKKIWNTSDALTAENEERLRGCDMADERAFTPALFSYHGLQYQSMAPEVMSADELAYTANHLRVLSGMYGVVRPFDGVVPYRLEMQARLDVPADEHHHTATKTIYEFWGGRIAAHLIEEHTDIFGPERVSIINLASEEYSKAVLPYLPADTEIVTCRFVSPTKSGKLTSKATESKIARGSMVRFAAECAAQTPEVLQSFTVGGFVLDESLSDASTYVFVRRDA